MSTDDLLRRIEAAIADEPMVSPDDDLWEHRGTAMRWAPDVPEENTPEPSAWPRRISDEVDRLFPPLAPTDLPEGVFERFSEVFRSGVSVVNTRPAEPGSTYENLVRAWESLEARRPFAPTTSWLPGSFVSSCWCGGMVGSLLRCTPDPDDPLERPRLLAEPCLHEVEVTIQQDGDRTVVTLSEPVPSYGEQVRAALADICRQVGTQLRPAFERVAEAFREAAQQATAFAEATCPVEATRGASASRVPTYRDDRPRHESPYGPRRRRR